MRGDWSFHASIDTKWATEQCQFCLEWATEVSMSEWMKAQITLYNDNAEIFYATGSLFYILYCVIVFEKSFKEYDEKRGP